MLTLEILSLSIMICSLKKMFVHMLVKFERNCVVQTIRNFELFNKTTTKKVLFCFVFIFVFLTTFDKALTPFWKMFQ